MKIRPYLTLALALLLLFADTARAQQELFTSDSSLLNEDFKNGIPEQWSTRTSGSNRKDVSVKDGKLCFNPGKGDNDIAISAEIDPTQPFVIDIAFEVPTVVKNRYSLVTLDRANGAFSVSLVPKEETMNVVMGTKTLGTIHAGEPYTLSLLCEPDGTYKGVITGATVEKPKVGVYTDADGVIASITLGNNVGAGEGSLLIDSVRIGKPVRH